MTNLLLVGAGGFLGAVARYLVGGWILHHSMAAKFPWGTFTINVLGCLVIGVLSGVAERFDTFGHGARLFLFTGLLGGFTTFSAFGLETIFLMRRGEWFFAALYVGASVVLCLFAVSFGWRLVNFTAR
jgi:fluoride exporter